MRANSIFHAVSWARRGASLTRCILTGSRRRTSHKGNRLTVTVVSLVSLLLITLPAFGQVPTLDAPIPGPYIGQASTTNPSFGLHLNGTNFVNPTTLNFNGSARETFFWNSNEIYGIILASDLTISGTATITASNVNGTSNSLPFLIYKTSQIITFNALPNKLAADPPFTVSATTDSGLPVSFSATGICTVSGSTITLNGAVGTCTITASQGGNATYNAAGSVSQSFSVNKLAQTITFGALGDKLRDDPTFTVSATADSGLIVTLTASGSCSVSGSAVTLTGTGTCTVTASQSGNATYSAAPNVAQSFTVNNPVPATTSLSPTFSPPGAAGFTLTVTGSGFVQTSTVQWNGSARTTTYVNGGQLTASILASDVASADPATVTVVNGAPGGGTSDPQTFTITYLAPTLTSLNQTSIPMGSGDLALTLTGTNFYNGASTVQWNGTALATTYVSGTQLTATIPTANLAAPDTATITVSTTSPGGGISNSKAFTILPTLTIGPLTQDGWNVTAAVTWPTDATVTNQVVNCGTTTTQTFTGPTGTCVYTKAGPFTITGTSTVGGTPSVQGPSQTVTIPLIVPTIATLSATLNGLQPAADGTIAPFRFPAAAAAAITLVRPAGIGIVDPLDLNVSRLAITPADGAPSNVFVRAGADVLQTTATGQLDAPATYTLQLNGQTVSGGAVTGSLTLIVAQGSPVLIFGNLVQDGFNVLMTVSWPDDLQGAVPVTINCGTPSTQLLTGTTGACRYTAADTFQLRGSYKSPETGAPTLQTTLQPVTIPLRVPIGADLSFAVNTVPVTGASITAYRLPAIVKSTVTLRLPEQIGIIDQLDVGPSRLSIGRAGGSTTAYRLSLGTNQTLTTNLSSFDAPGDYTISLNGQTVKGNAVTATQSLSVTAASISLILGPLVQDGDNVAVSVTWPSGVSPVSVTCGTSSWQTFTGSAGVCSYTRPGSFQIAGTFVNPEDNSNFAAASATATIPAITPVNPQIALQVNSQSATDSASTYRVPSLLKATITMERPAGIGVLDRLDTQNSTVSIIPEGMASTRYRPMVRDNPLVAVADGELRRAGSHTIAFEGKTLSGQTLSATVPLTLDLGKATLETDPPAQDGNAVIVRVRWPVGGPTGTINCGFMSQTLTATGGACRYTRAGSYQIIGFFSDPARGSTVLTDPVPVTIPLLAPTQASLTVVSVNSAGVSSDTTGQIPLFTTMQPQSYPVGVRLKVTLTRPDGIGVLDVIDRSHSSLTAAAVADGANPIPVGMSLGSGPLELTALASLRSFSPDPTDPSRWRYQFTFTGQALGGSVYSAQTELVGSIGGPSPLTLQVSRAAPSIPYAPATYQYSLTGARSATLAEPLTATWTVTPDGQPPGQTVQNSRMMVTFEGPGTYQIQLTVRGPFSGASTWFDTVTIPVLPDAGTPTITITTPQQNRPPATYRFVAVTPPMSDRRERIGVPTWTVEGATVSTPALVTTFTTAGSHQVGVSVPTSYGRTLDAQTTVTINPNQPPVGTVDCSRSSYWQLTKKYALYCRATAADPDGRISALKWNIPELQYERLDTTVLILERDQPVAITVELHITDNSGDETVVSVPIDMAQLPIQ